MRAQGKRVADAQDGSGIDHNEIELLAKVEEQVSHDVRRHEFSRIGRAERAEAEDVQTSGVPPRPLRRLARDAVAGEEAAVIRLDADRRQRLFNRRPAENDVGDAHFPARHGHRFGERRVVRVEIDEDNALATARERHRQVRPC